MKHAGTTTHAGTGARAVVRVLIASVAPDAGELRDALEEDFSVDVATTLDEALQAIEIASPQVVIVGYHFDHLRPYRLIQALAADHPHIRVLLVRTMRLLLPHEGDDAVGDAYRAMGVADYLVLDDEAGSSASASIRRSIAALLST